MTRVAQYFDSRSKWLSLLIAITSAILLPTGASAQQADRDRNGDGELLRQFRGIDWDSEIGGARIVGGSTASPGAWPNYVAVLFANPDTKQGGYCGGSIIDREWVLTAGHCIHKEKGWRYAIVEGTNRQKKAFSAVKTSTFETLVNSGTVIPVSDIVLHEGFGNPCAQRKENCIGNDIALLRLSRPATTQGQILLSNKLRPTYLVDHKLSIVVGYGLLKPNDPTPITHLRQVDVPLVAQSRCAGVYGSDAIGDFAICAGLDQGGKDSCQGDSGGPLYELSKLNQPIQIGIVSWGKGCAQPNAYGVYASVGFFEDWIRSHVPNARFATGDAGAPGTDQQLGSYLGDNNAAPPSQMAQVSVDVLPGAQVRVGSEIEVRVTSSVAGHLLVVNQERDGSAYQLFPNKYSGNNRIGEARTDIAAGQTVTVPDVMDRFKLTVTPPAGMNRIIAVVVPSSVRMSDLASQHADMRPIADLNALLKDISDRTRGIRVDEAAPKNRAIGIREYEIVE